MQSPCRAAEVRAIVLFLTTLSEPVVGTAGQKLTFVAVFGQVRGISTTSTTRRKPSASSCTTGC